MSTTPDLPIQPPDLNLVKDIIQSASHCVRQCEPASLAGVLDSAKQNYDIAITRFVTPFLLAVNLSNRQELVDVFLDRGMPINIMSGMKNIFGTPIESEAAVHHAQSVASIEHLHARGADFECKTHEGQTALHKIAKLIQRKNQLELILTLLACGVNVNARDSQGRTPLLIMVDAIADLGNNDTNDFTIKHCMPTLEVLLEAGAHINARDITGRTALGLLLSKAGSGTRISSHALIPTLLRHGADIDIEAGQVEGVVSYAIMHDDLKVFKQMLTLRDQGSWNPAHISSEKSIMLEASGESRAHFVSVMVERGWVVDNETLVDIESLCNQCAAVVRSGNAKAVAQSAIFLLAEDMSGNKSVNQKVAP